MRKSSLDSNIFQQVDLSNYFDVPQIPSSTFQLVHDDYSGMELFENKQEEVSYQIEIRQKLEEQASDEIEVKVQESKQEVERTASNETSRKRGRPKKSVSVEKKQEKKTKNQKHPRNGINGIKIQDFSTLMIEILERRGQNGIQFDELFNKLVRFFFKSPKRDGQNVALMEEFITLKKNVRRRLYDTLNILISTKIIKIVGTKNSSSVRLKKRGTIKLAKFCRCIENNMKEENLTTRIAGEEMEIILRKIENGGELTEGEMKSLVIFAKNEGIDLFTLIDEREHKCK